MSESSRFHRPGPDDVHVWWIDLCAAVTADAFLAPDERARAARFRHDRDRVRWVRAHAALRHILAGYLGLPAHDVQFAPAETPHIPPSPIAMGEGQGVRAVRVRAPRAATPKPALRNDPRLCFNFAHANDRAALAVAWQREVGIDLEMVDPALNLRPLLPSVCTPAEMARVEAFAPDERAREFLILWTIKEAYLKAIGLGLYRDPRLLETERLPHGGARLRDAEATDGSLRFQVQILDAGPGWAAALAVAGTDLALQAFTWPAEPDAPS